VVLVALVALAGCAEDASEPAATEPAEPPRREPPPRALRCPESSGNCSAAAGRIVYVERVDPDGDGDAHFVLASRESITGPGISVIDVRRELRPSPLPRPGDWISATGPVYEGSYGQRQIEAVRIRVRRRG
jgi:hypothetical protein